MFLTIVLAKTALIMMELENVENLSDLNSYIIKCNLCCLA
jgi:hypothetical protein